MSDETTLTKTMRRDISESASVNMIDLTISIGKKGDPIFERFGGDACHVIEMTTKEEERITFLKSLAIKGGLAKKPIPAEVKVDAVIFDDATNKELLLVYPPDNLEKLFSNFLNDLEKKGWIIKIYEHVMKRGRLL